MDAKKNTKKRRKTGAGIPLQNNFTNVSPSILFFSPASLKFCMSVFLYVSFSPSFSFLQFPLRQRRRRSTWPPGDYWRILSISKDEGKKVAHLEFEQFASRGKILMWNFLIRKRCRKYLRYLCVFNTFSINLIKPVISGHFCW